METKKKYIFIILLVPVLAIIFFVKNSYYFYIQPIPTNDIDLTVILNTSPIIDRIKRDRFSLSNERIAIIDDYFKVYIANDIALKKELENILKKEILLSKNNYISFLKKNIEFLMSIKKRQKEKGENTKNINHRIIENEMLLNAINQSNINFFVSEIRNNYFKIKSLITLILIEISIMIILLILQPQIRKSFRK